VSAQVISNEDRQRQAQTQELLMQVPTPNFIWLAHAIKQPAVHAPPSHVGGSGVQVPPLQVAPPVQSAFEQQAAAQTQLFPCCM
jgi:hypothetical protein